MAKKVVRLTESQLRLMINKVISEQKVPAVPQKNQNPNVPTTQKLKREDFILKEMLENLSKGIYVYASKMEPTKIIMVNREGVVKHSGAVTRGRDTASTIGYNTYTILDNIKQGGILQVEMELLTETMNEALSSLNNNVSVVKTVNTDDSLAGIDDLSRVFMYLASGREEKFEFVINLLKTAQPNIVPKLITSLELRAKNERVPDLNKQYYSELEKVIKLTGQQPQQQK
jgi:hypothetical protein